ncbi:MAG: hypothetical protein Q7K42_02060 [Candidatus Diapherotrites archaeon]|nr:hypothetical protein [Candidatus Diapherotrites archaeon]
MTGISEKILEFTRRGDFEKVKWLKNIGKTIQQSQKMRIAQNDKSVLKELILPKWVNWDLLFTWALASSDKEGKQACIICHTVTMLGTGFKGKFLCGECISDLKLILTTTNSMQV